MQSAELVTEITTHASKILLGSYTVYVTFMVSDPFKVVSL